MKDKSNVQFGMELENYIAEKFKELGFPNACRSNGSGNKGSIGDISGIDYFAVEAKNRNTESVTIKKETWDKLTSSIPLHSNRLPMLVLRNKNKQTFCVMEANDMFTILKGWMENTQRRV
jgi:Holliday junction resolvase